jgi:hypothetical protein
MQVMGHKPKEMQAKLLEYNKEYINTSFVIKLKQRKQEVILIPLNHLK